MPEFPARTSSLRSAITTRGRGCWLKRERRMSFWYAPRWACHVVSTVGVADPSTSTAPCWVQRNLATSRAWYRGGFSDW